VANITCFFLGFFFFPVFEELFAKFSEKFVEPDFAFPFQGSTLVQ